MGFLVSRSKVSFDSVKDVLVILDNILVKRFSGKALRNKPQLSFLRSGFTKSSSNIIKV